MKWLFEQILIIVNELIDEKAKKAISKRIKFSIEKIKLKKKIKTITDNFVRIYGNKEYYNLIDRYLYENKVIIRLIDQFNTCDYSNKLSMHELANNHAIRFINENPIFKRDQNEIIGVLENLINEIFNSLNVISDENVRKLIAIFKAIQTSHTEVLTKVMEKGFDNINQSQKESGKKLSELLSHYSHSEEGTSPEHLKSVLGKAFISERENNPSVDDKNFDDGILPQGYIIEHEVTAKINKEKNMALQEYLKETWNSNKQNHISITGIGGIGKTVVLFNTQYPVPVVYVPLRSLSFDLQKCNEYILKYIKTITLNYNDDYFKSFLNLCDQAWKTGPNIILLLDGINEIPPQNLTCIINEIKDFWIKKQGTQLILTSRYDINNLLNVRKVSQVYIEPLSIETIEKYLTKRNISFPDKTSRIWNVIDTPLMLRLYAESELREGLKHSHRSSHARWREKINAGSIIWNYLQSELCKIEKLNALECIVAIHFVAPYICYKMSEEKIFEITNNKFSDYIHMAFDKYEEMLSCRQLPDIIISTMNTTPSQKINVDNFYLLLTNTFRLFCDKKDKIQLVHQHFRDCFAAMYVLQIVDNAKTLPEEWKKAFDSSITDFICDLLITEPCHTYENSTWKKIWDFGHQKDVNSFEFTKRMLNIYKKTYGTDASKIDFSEMDLSEIPLSSFRFTQESKGHFCKAKINYGTFFGNAHSDTVSSVSWSSNENYYISASHDCSIRIYDCINNKCESLDKYHKHYIRCAQCCPTDENIIASAGDDKQLICWSRIQVPLENGETTIKWKPKAIGECSDWIRSLQWDHEGKRILCGDGKGDIKLFCEDNMINFEHKHSGNVRHLCWLRNKKLIASGADDGTVCVWTDSGKCIFEQQLKNPITSVSWIQKGEFLIVSTTKFIYTYVIKYIDECNNVYVELLARKEVSKEEISLITCAEINNTDYIAIFYNDMLSVFCTTTVEGEIQFDEIGSCKYAEETNKIITAEWNHNCDKIICGARDGSVICIDILKNEENNQRIFFNIIGRRCSKAARCSSWSPNGKWLAVGYDDCTIRIWSPFEERCLSVLKSHTDSIKCLCWSPDSHKLLSGSDDNSVKLWSGTSIENLAPETLYKHSQPVNSMLWLNNGLIVSASDDKSLIFSRADDLKTQRVKINHTQRVYSLSSSPDEKYIVSAGNDSYFILWDTSNLSFAKFDTGHTAPTRAIAWSADNNFIITSSNDCTINLHLFDCNKQNIDKSMPLPKIHDDFIYGANISKNGKYIISGSTDTSVGFWDISTQKFIYQSKVHSGFVWNVSASNKIEDKYYVATSSSDGTVKIWDVTNPNIVAFEPLYNLPVIPDSDIVGCDFSEAIICDQELTKLIYANGGCCN